MAKVSKTILGEIKGTLGDFVFRTMNGKTFVSLRPQKYKKTKSKALENIRTGFSMLSSFCSCVNSISELTKVWALKQVSGNRTYNKIYSHNNPFIKDYSNYSILKILPQNPNYILFIDKLTKNKNQISFKIRKMESEFLRPSNKYTLIILVNNFSGRKYLHQINTLSYTEISQNSSVIIDFSESLLGLDTYNNVFCAITIKDENDKILSWTNTEVLPLTL